MGLNFIFLLRTKNSKPLAIAKFDEWKELDDKSLDSFKDLDQFTKIILTNGKEISYTALYGMEFSREGKPKMNFGCRETATHYTFFPDPSTAKLKEGN